MPGGVRSLFWIAGKGREGRESLLEGWEKSVGPPGGQEGLGVSPGRMEGVRSPTWKAGEVKSTPRRDGRIGRSTNRAGCGLEVIPESREGSGIPPGGLGGVGRPFWRFRRGRESHTGAGCPTLELGGVARPSWRAGRGWEALLEW